MAAAVSVDMDLAFADIPADFIADDAAEAAAFARRIHAVLQIRYAPTRPLLLVLSSSSDGSRVFVTSVSLYISPRPLMQS